MKPADLLFMTVDKTMVRRWLFTVALWMLQTGLLLFVTYHFARSMIFIRFEQHP